jgi:anti-sigma regulatory factor (Ser/Thr protein kinase)/biotin operon repressor
VSKIRERSEQIRQFILTNVEEHPKDVTSLASQEFGITRQAINKHIQYLVEQKAITVQGSTKNRSYHLQLLVDWEQGYLLNKQLQEDVVWDADIKPLIADLSDNARDIWAYGFTEMLNNAIDHSSGTGVFIQVKRTAINSTIIIHDNGEGIFKKIQRELQLNDERHAVLELAKGKLTTDPDRHSGQGIFFTSRMFDDFGILSGNVSFLHEFNQAEDWIFEENKSRTGTTVFMKLNNNTSRTAKEVFDNFSSGDDYAFTKTVVPVRLVQYGKEMLVSRSQAKRLLTNVDKFKVVMFDFSGIEAIGQAFADEIFRVFKKQHPEMEIMSLNTNKEVAQMISRAESAFNA